VCVYVVRYIAIVTGANAIRFFSFFIFLFLYARNVRCFFFSSYVFISPYSGIIFHARGYIQRLVNTRGYVYIFRGRGGGGGDGGKNDTHNMFYRRARFSRTIFITVVRSYDCINIFDYGTRASGMSCTIDIILIDARMYRVYNTFIGFQEIRRLKNESIVYTLRRKK